MPLDPLSQYEIDNIKLKLAGVKEQITLTRREATQLLNIAEELNRKIKEIEDA